MESRTHRLKQRLLDSPFEICAERAVLWTDSQRSTEGRPQVVRNALSLANVLANMAVSIRDGELIVGNRTSKLRGSPLFPETKSFSIEAQLDSYDTRPIQPYRIGADEKRALKKALPYWRGRSAWDMAFRIMPRDVQTDVYKLMFTIEAEFANGIGHFIVGNPNLLSKGLGGIRDEAARLLSSSASVSKERADFREAVIITANASIEFAHRYAAEARRLIAVENDLARKEELLRIALICDRVPEHPPRDFREAIQAIWFNQLICQLECGGFAISPGRLDQLLYPFYKRDVMQRRLTPDQAQELVECLNVKLSEVVNVLDTILLPVTSGPPIAQSLTIGGTNTDGTDATSELSHIFLKAFDNIRTVSPNLAVRFHQKTPTEFSLRVYDAVRSGAMMSLFNDDVIVAAMERTGVSTADARDYAIVGCVEPAAPGKTFGSTDSNLVNIARCLELALHNGNGMDLASQRKALAGQLTAYTGQKNPARNLGTRNEYMSPDFSPDFSNGGRAQSLMLVKYLASMRRHTKLNLIELYRSFRGKGVGLRTGNSGMFTSFDEVMRAYKAQVEHAVGRMVEAMYYVGMAHAELKPTPFISSTIDDCVARGMDVTWGGARYNFTGPQAVGLADVADSLAAVRTLVFDQHKISMGQLTEALKNNFAGDEPLRQMLINKAPKYGNDDEDADALAKEAAGVYCRAVEKHRNYRGGKFQPGVYSMSSHIVFGILTGATPDGRKAGEPLASGVSPSRGKEVKGPTAVLRSVAKVDNRLISNGCVLNMTMNPDLVAGDENLQKFFHLNRAYFDLGGLHVQYNIVDANMLRDAQKSPEKYSGLVVRVAGYSALFTQLDRATQNDIIARTAHGCEQ